MSEMNLYQALLSAQKAFGPVVKNSVNPAFRTKYADLGAVIEAVTAPLHAHGLLLVQRLDYDASPDGPVPVLLTELIHADTGERLTSRAVIACKDPSDPQKVGGAVTYYRRYSLMALLGLAQEDDDGNAASKPAERRESATSATNPRVHAGPQSSATAQVKSVAAAQPYPATKIATWTDDQLWAYACDESGQEAKRKATFAQYLGRLATEVDILFASEQMTALHPEDVAALRDKALAALRQAGDQVIDQRQPAGV